MELLSEVLAVALLLVLMELRGRLAKHGWGDRRRPSEAPCGPSETDRGASEEETP